MELWQVIVVGILAFAFLAYVCLVFFFAGLVTSSDISSKDLPKELAAAFIAASLWPLWLILRKHFERNGKESNQ